MTHPPRWALRYLERIAMDVHDPDLDYLGQLVRARLGSLAFENLSKMHYLNQFPHTGWYVPDLDTYAEDMHAMDFGGLCHSGNFTFQQLLGCLGFDSYNVSFGSHMGTVVRLDGNAYYVDVAVGSPTYAPVDVTKDTLIETCGYRIHFYPDPGDPAVLHMDLGHESQMRRWTANTKEPVPFEAFADIIRASNRPKSLFTSMLCCQLWQPDQARVLSIVNHSFTVRHADGRTETRKMETSEEIESVLAEEYRLPRLPVREAIAVLSGLGVDVFSPPTRERVAN